jgi:hypothetical protein
MLRLVLASLLAIVTLVPLVATAVAADTFVHGYTRKDGTYVQPHFRSAPDGNRSNNWSTQGNVNPYTGQPGTRSPDSFSNPGSGLGTQPNYLDTNPYKQRRR